MDTRRLNYFVAVAEEKSVTKAAARLHMAQPPLSQQIKSLEEELGFALFVRSNRKIELTANGAAFLLEVRQVLQQMSELRERAVRRARGGLGVLRVGVYGGFMTDKFAEAIQGFLRANPDWKLSLFARPSSWLIEAIQENKIDVAFILSAYQLGNKFTVYTFAREAMRLAVPAGHALAKKAKIEWADLETADLILLDPEVVVPDYYSALFSLCRGFALRASHYAMNINNQLWLVSAGLGIAPVASKETRAGVVLKPLPKNAPTFETSLIWNRSDNSAQIAKFVQYVTRSLA